MSDVGKDQDNRLREKAESCLGTIERLNMSLRNHLINDYGEVTGFCEEADDIWNDLHDYLGKTTSRAARTLRRINKVQQAYTEQFGDKDPVVAFAELRERFGDAFDQIEDVGKFVSELRSEDHA